MLSAFTNSFKIPELRQRIFFTLAMIFVCRLLAAIPTPGVNIVELRAAINDVQNTQGGGMLALFNLFSGGALERFAVGALGIMPYISASIILQLMTAVVPTLERLAREGDTGRQKITQYTRYLTIGLCIIQGYAMAAAMENPAALGITRDVVITGGLGFRVLTVVCMTTGAMIMMWLGEQITDRGIGNGISLIITVSIVASLPSAVMATKNMFTPDEAGNLSYSPFLLISMILIFFLVTAATVAITQGQRKIPVQYAKRVVGRKVYGGQSTYMPLRVNYSGVMPIIFAQAILMFPSQIMGMVQVEWMRRFADAIAFGTPAYNITYALMIMFFSYFWVATQFNPIQIADDLKKHGGYIPGIRPGKPTAEFLDRTMTRITLAGATFLTIIAVIPTLIAQGMRVPFLVASFFGGTSLLIIVGVMLDTMRQIESHLLMRHYDGFLKKGKLRGRK